MTPFIKLCQQLEAKIQKAYQEGVTMDDAEKLAGEFLFAQLEVSKELKVADLDARMRKSGLKAVRATAYGEGIANSPDGKKPTETALEHYTNMHDLVKAEQRELDVAEVEHSDLMRYFNVFKEAHIHFRGISKGRFDG